MLWLDFGDLIKCFPCPLVEVEKFRCLNILSWLWILLMPLRVFLYAYIRTSAWWPERTTWRAWEAQSKSKRTTLDNTNLIYLRAQLSNVGTQVLRSLIQALPALVSTSESSKLYHDFGHSFMLPPSPSSTSRLKIYLAASDLVSSSTLRMQVWI